MRKRLFTLLLMLCPLLVAGGASAKDITVYVQLTGTNQSTPNIHYWGAASSNWPGVAMSGPVAVENPTTGTSSQFYYHTFSGLAENATINVIFNFGNGTAQTSNIEGLTSDHYYTWDGTAYGGLEDITEQFTAVPDATINSLTLAGSIDALGWEPGVDFTTVTANAEYTYELDLTDVTSDVEFKIRPNGGWVGIGNATLVAADGLVTGTDNFILKNSTSGYKT